MRRFATVAALSLFAACNARGLDFAEFDALPELATTMDSPYRDKVTITKFHHNRGTNGVTRCWIEFDCASFRGVLPDATNLTVMCCETVRAVFRGTDEEWRGMNDIYRARYHKIRMLSPWEPHKADFLKLREFAVDGYCFRCDETNPHRHAVFSATIDVRPTRDYYGDFNNGHHFYISADYLIDGE